MGPEQRQKGNAMGRLFKFILILIVLGALALVGFAYFTDLSPDQTPVSEPVQLDAG